MGFFKFYGIVFREALRHSLDIAQAVIFVLLILAGLIVARNPSIKPTIDALNLSGTNVALVVLGSIISIQLILAPYWLWRAAQARIVSLPNAAVDYQLRVVGFGNRNDKKRKLIQIVFHLRNSLPVPLQYEVEDIEATVMGDRNDNPIFENMGGIIPANATNTFDFSPIALSGKSWIKPGTEGTAAITYKYGIAGKPFARRAKYVAKIIIEKTSIRHLTIEDSEDAI